MANKPEFLSQFYEREGTREARSLHKAMYRIATQGIRTMDREEIKKVGLPIIREVRKRMIILEEEGLTDSPAYQFLKSKNLSISTAGKNLNTIRQNVMEAYNFLHTKTSTEEGAREYNQWLDEHLGAETSKEQREMIWDLVHRFEDSHTNLFINYGYDEAIKRIAKASRMADFDIDEAFSIFTEYLEGKGLLHDLERGADRELDEGGRSGWMKGRSSMSDF